MSAPPRAVPAGRPLRGSLRVPPSKSLTHRHLILALLAWKPAVLERPLLAEDTRLSLRALAACGVRIEEEAGEVRLFPGLPSAGARHDCGNAGTLCRFLVATLATLPGTWEVDGSPRLRERPVGPLVRTLTSLGARVEWLGREGFPPLRVLGGHLPGGTVLLDAGESSQYLSALLMAGLRARAPLRVEVSALTSQPYVDLTLEAIHAWGGRVERVAPAGFVVHPSRLRGGRFPIEGDASAGAYLAAAAALSGGVVRLEGLRRQSRQGDLGFLRLLDCMGAGVTWRGSDAVEVSGTGRLRAVDADLSAMPDQAPTLAALAPFAQGTTRIRGVAHLRLKESDRLAAMAQELSRLGADVRESPDGLVIAGSWSDRDPPSSSVVVDSHADHRIAMSLAVAGLRRPGTRVADPETVGKSYPGFWEDLESLLA